MLTVGVTGVSGLLGQRLLPLLDADAEVGRIVGLDVRSPARRARGLETHRVDIATGELKPLLERVDVIVHLAAVVDPLPDAVFETRVNVAGTRRVLDAAAAVGVRKVVRMSSATVYGAWPDNRVPLTEAATLRPNPGLGPAVQAAEVERLLAEWHAEHPGVTVTTLRAAPVLGAGAAHLWARLLAGRAPLRVRGTAPPVQVVHADDAARALHLAIRRDLPGIYNLAADGWLDAAAADCLRPRSFVGALPRGVLERALRRLWSTGLGDVPPAALPYLAAPWVISNDRLRAAGWVPQHSNAETLRETAEALVCPVPGARLAARAAAALGVTGAVWVLVRRTRGRRG